MADNKKKTGWQDDNLISFKQKYEFNYAIKQLQKRFPDEKREIIKEVLVDAAKAISPSEGREKIMRQARKNLRD